MRFAAFLPTFESDWLGGWKVYCHYSKFTKHHRGQKFANYERACRYSLMAVINVQFGGTFGCVRKIPGIGGNFVGNSSVLIFTPPDSYLSAVCECNSLVKQNKTSLFCRWLGPDTLHFSILVPSRLTLRKSNASAGPATESSSFSAALPQGMHPSETDTTTHVTRKVHIHWLLNPCFEHYIAIYAIIVTRRKQSNLFLTHAKDRVGLRMSGRSWLIDMYTC